MGLSVATPPAATQRTNLSRSLPRSFPELSSGASDRSAVDACPPACCDSRLLDHDADHSHLPLPADAGEATYVAGR